MIYEINHIWTAEMKWKWRKMIIAVNGIYAIRNLCNWVKKSEKSPEFFFQAALCNCINCVHCNDHFFIFSLYCGTECLQRVIIIWWQNNGTHKLCAFPQVKKTYSSWIFSTVSINLHCGQCIKHRLGIKRGLRTMHVYENSFRKVTLRETEGGLA